MPKNKGKGGKNRRRGKNENEDLKRELIMKEEGQGYAKVDRMLGNGRLIASCFDDGQQRLCHIRGKLRKKIWVNQGDVVLLGLREFQDGKADVIFKYSTDEARRLKQLNEIPENANIDPDPANAGNEDIAFEYAASSSGAEDSSEEEEEDLRAPGARSGGARLVKHEVPLENPNRRLGPEPGDLPPSSSEEDEEEEEEGQQQTSPSGRRGEPAPARTRVPAREASDEEEETPDGEQGDGSSTANNLYGGLRAGAGAGAGTSSGGGSKPKYTEKTRTGRVLNEREARRGQRGLDSAADGDVDHI